MALITYYVSPSGNDSNSGSNDANALLSITEANTRAKTDITAGDEVLIRLLGNALHDTGDGFDGSDFASGVPTRVINWEPYSTGKPQLVRSSQGSQGLYKLDDVQYVYFTGIVWIDNDNLSGGYTELVSDSIVIVEGAAKFLTFDDNEVLNAEGHSFNIRGSATDITIIRSMIDQNRMTTSNTGEGVLTKTANNQRISVIDTTITRYDHVGVFFDQGSDLLVQNCIIELGAGKGIQLGSTSARQAPCGNVTIEDTVIRSIALAPTEAAGDTASKPHTGIDCGQSESSSTVYTITGNQIYVTDGGGIKVTNESDAQVIIEHNTIARVGIDNDSNSQEMALLEVQTSYGGNLVRVRDNIFAPSTSDDDYTDPGASALIWNIETTTGFEASYNIFWPLAGIDTVNTVAETILLGGTTYSTLTDFFNASHSYKGNSSHSNPLFNDASNNDYTLQTGSPALAAASDGGNIGALGLTSGAGLLEPTGIASAEAFGTPSISLTSSALELQVGASNNDADETAGGDVNIDRNYIRLLAQDGKAGARFTNVTIAQGAGIGAATLSLYVFEPTRDDAIMTVYGVDNDDTVGFAVAQDDIGNRVRTTASTSVNQTGIAAGGAVWLNIDVTTIVQEIVNRAGWVSGNAMVMLLYGGVGVDLRWRSYDHSNVFGAKLSISLTVTQTLQPTGITSAEAFGASTLSQAFGDQFLQPDGIASVEAFGTAIAALADSLLQPDGIASAEAFGSLTARQPIQPTGIASAEGVGQPLLPSAGTTINEQVGASADDADETAGGSMDLTRAYVRVAADGAWAGVRFTSVNIAQGASISVATLQLYAFTSSNDDAVFTVRGEDADDAGTFTSTADDISGRTMTTASTAVNTTAIAAGGATWFSIDVTSIVQEIVNRGGWSANNALVITFEGASGTDMRWRSNDHFDTSLATKLDVTTQGAQTVRGIGIETAETFGTTEVIRPHIISPTSIATAEAFGTVELLRGVLLQPDGIVSAETFGDAVTAFSVAPTGIATAEAFGTQTISAGNITLSVSGIESAEAFGTGSITLDLFTLRPPSIESAEAFGASFVAQPIQPSGIASGETFGQIVLNFISNTLYVPGIASGEAFGASTVRQPLQPNSIASAEAFGTPQLNIISNTLIVSGIASGEAFGASTVRQPLQPNGIASAEAFGTPQLNIISNTLIVSGIASGEAFGASTVRQPLQPNGIASAETFGALTINQATAVLLPNGIASAEAFGASTVRLPIQPAGIASREAFGTLGISQATAVLLPNGIASAEAFGASTVRLPIQPTGIASREAFGALNVAPALVIISPLGITSAEAFGSLFVTQPIQPSGIASAEAFGTLGLALSAVTLHPTGIASAEAFGTLGFDFGTVTIQPTGIASAEAFGTLGFDFGVITIQPTGIASAEMIGALLVALLSGTTPDSRIYIVPAAKRVYVAEADRTIIVPASARVYKE